MYVSPQFADKRGPWCETHVASTIASVGRTVYVGVQLPNALCLSARVTSLVT